MSLGGCMQFRKDLSKKKRLGLLILGLLAFGGVGTIFWVVPDAYHFLIIVGIFCFGLAVEVASAKKRNRNTK